MRKKIIILIHYMELGGVETSLIGLLSALDPKRVDIDLFIYSHQGEMMKYVPGYVNILDEIRSYSMFERPLIELVKYFEFKMLFARLKSKYLHKKYLKNNPQIEIDASISQFLGDCVTPVLPSINPGTNYDLCISFMIPHNIGVSKVKADKKIAWIHTDYSTISINKEAELPIWDKYDYIASISEDVTRSFIKTFPSLVSKIKLIENILPEVYVRKRAEEYDVSAEITSEPGEVAILSIGRFVHQKNFDNVPEICRLLLNFLSINSSKTVMNSDNALVPGCNKIDSELKNLRWYIIGYGNDETLIRQKIAAAGMEDHVILLGKKENPYPYIKVCDIYVQPSRYEGKSVTVREAQMLGKPVVVTAYPTAPSQINDSQDGIIVPSDNEGCARGLADFIKNLDKQKKLIEFCKDNDFSNRSEIEKIYDLMK